MEKLIKNVVDHVVQCNDKYNSALEVNAEVPGYLKVYSSLERRYIVNHELTGNLEKDYQIISAEIGYTLWTTGLIK